MNNYGKLSILIHVDLPNNGTNKVKKSHYKTLATFYGDSVEAETFCRDFLRINQHFTANNLLFEFQPSMRYINLY
jgi:hypothetical protein